MFFSIAVLKAKHTKYVINATFVCGADKKRSKQSRFKTFHNNEIVSLLFSTILFLLFWFAFILENDFFSYPHSSGL